MCEGGEEGDLTQRTQRKSAEFAEKKGEWQAARFA